MSKTTMPLENATCQHHHDSDAYFGAPTFMIRSLPIIYHGAYSAPQLPLGHRFPMGVFRRIYEQLLATGVVKQEQVYIPTRLPSREDLELVHDKSYISAFCSGCLDNTLLRRIGFGDVTKEPRLIERTKAEVAGTLLTAEFALETGLACNTAGGTHHAFPSFGSGYCIIHDMAVASKVKTLKHNRRSDDNTPRHSFTNALKVSDPDGCEWLKALNASRLVLTMKPLFILLRSGRVSRVLIFDLDVHQGDGTAAIFANDPSVYTVSVHCQSNFPTRKQKSTIDIGLPDGTDDDAYLKVVSNILPDVLMTFKPDLVFYDAGVDPHKNDGLGKLSLTDSGLYRREMMVIDTCLSAGVPIACVVGGGYDRDVNLLAQRHCLVHKAASMLWRDHRL